MKATPVISKIYKPHPYNAARRKGVLPGSFKGNLQVLNADAPAQSSFDTKDVQHNGGQQSSVPTSSKQPYQIPVSDVSKNQQQLAPKKKEQAEGTHKIPISRGVLEDLYYLNSSESKKIAIGLQPKEQGSGYFKVEIRLAKAGWRGVVLSVEEWNKFMEMLDLVENHLQGKANQLPSTQVLSEKHSVRFLNFWGKKVIEITSTIEPGKHPESVCMALASWKGLMNLIPCIRHSIQQKTHCVEFVDKFYENYINIIWEHIGEMCVGCKSGEGVHQCWNKQFLLECIQSTCITPQVSLPSEEYEVDCTQLFHEVQAFCKVFTMDCLMSDFIPTQKYPSDATM